MEISVTYTDLKDRDIKGKEQEAKGLRMLHDNFDVDWQSGDEPHGTMIITDVVIPPTIPTPPCSSHISVLTAINPANVKPATIKRIWDGRDYFYDCFVTQTVRDEFGSGKIVIGDYVIVLFEDTGTQIVTAKVFRSW